jgi:hypothetical protein
MHFVLLCAWGVCLFVAFLGYGKLLLGLLQVRDAPWAFAAAIGVSVLVTAGGVLNLLHLVTTPMLIGVVVAGAMLALALDWRHLRSLPATLLNTSILYAPLIIAAAIPVLGNVRADIRTFNTIDDFPAYLTIPAATHDLGTLPFDPFSERRITSCLGAPYVLQSLMLVAGDVRSIRFIDVSIGFVLYVGLLLTILRMMGLPVLARISLAFLALLVPVDRWNATMVVLPAALFCTLLLIQIHPDLGGRLNWRRTVLLGMTAAALSCMKSNYLPTSVAICGFYYAAWLVYRRRATPLLQGVLWAVVLILCMLPWMIDMRHKEGTFLFPIFGAGYDASAYGAIPLPSGSHGQMGSAALWVWLTTLPMATPLVIALGGLALAFRKRVEAAWINPLAAMLAGSVVGIAAIGSSTGGESIGRYSLPFQLPALIIFLGFLVACRRELRQWTWWLIGSGAATVVALVVFAVAFGVRHHDYERYLEDAKLANFPDRPQVNLEREEQRVRSLQARVPAGARILARLYLTYPFDFRRNQVFVADYAGMAGLPPGMPIEGGPEQMRAYLLSHGIRYLAFDPKRTMFPDEAPDSSLQSLLHGNRNYGRHGWLVLQVKVSDAVQTTFAQLGERYPHLYDDGFVYVLDLDTRTR